MADWAGTAAWLAALAAVGANAVEAWADPGGALWAAIRFGLATLFALALAAWLIGRLRRSARG